MSTPDTALPGGRRARAAFGALVAAWGVQAIVAQSLLLREALVLMFGSELAWGVVLFAWLLGVAIGGTVGGVIAERIRGLQPALIAVLLLLSVAVCAELWAFRGARAWLGVGPGGIMPLSKTALAAVLFISPASALVGLSFPLACRVAGGSRNSEPKGAGPLAGIYALESAGSLIGGAAFSFWAVEHLAPIQSALLCAALTAAACGAWLVFSRPRFVVAGGGSMAIALAACGVCVWAGDDLNLRLVDRRWQNLAPGYELVAEVESKYQNLAVGRRAGQFTLYCDGQVAVDFPDPYTFVPLAHFWMCEHPAPRRVLILGGGAEGLLAEILRHPIEHVDYVEPDPRQIDLVTPYLDEADRRALADPNVTVHYMDARYFVKTQRDRFDLVIARLPEPTSALRARFYTDEFYGELRRAMTARSVLCMTVTAAPGELSAISGEYLASVRATVAGHFPHITVSWGDPAHLLAATDTGLVSVNPKELTERFAARHIESRYFHPLWFEGATDWLEPDKLSQRSDELKAVNNFEISTDLRPVVYMQRLVLWERMMGRESGGVIERLRAVGWPELVAFLLALGVASLIPSHLRKRRLKESNPAMAGACALDGAVVLSVGATGFVTMALSIVWLFAFQNLYGYVYQRIGWIIAVFMAGLVVGCLMVDERCRRAAGARDMSLYLCHRLIAVDLLLALLSVAVPTVLSALGAAQGGEFAFVLVEWVILLMVGLTGVLGGAAFALAGGLKLKSTGRAGAAAGTIVWADHIGACIGALLTGVLLVPVFGTPATTVLLAGIKIASAGWLALTPRLGTPGQGGCSAPVA